LATIVFGGSFDPIHTGHIAMAKVALDYLPQARLLMIPAACSPFKTDSTSASEIHRLSMCRLATANQPRITVSDIEFTLPKPSFTVHTIQALLKKENDTYYFLCGADAFLSLQRWKDYETLVKLVSFLVVDRSEYPRQKLVEQKERVEGLGGRADILNMPLVTVSSTQIRQRLQNRQSLHNLVDPAVERYLMENNLYRE